MDGGAVVPAEPADEAGTQAMGAVRRGAPRTGAVSLALLLLASLVLAAAADWLFLRRELGWTAGIFLFAVLTGLVLTQRAALRRRAGRTIAVLLGGLVLALVIHPTPQAVLLALAGVVALALVARQGWVGSVGAWTVRYVIFGVYGTAQPFRDMVAVGQLRARRPGARARWRVAAWIVPLALGCVFLGLFAAANPVIEGWTDTVFASLDAFLRGLDAARIGLWILVGWAAWALLRTRTEVTAASTPGAAMPALLSDGVIVRCLLVFNALFLLQNGMDCRYLWLGGTLPDGMTYAQYAHRGAYPLVFTALLAAAFVLVTFRVGARPSAWARRLVFLWLAQNVLLTAFALWRLGLYVEVYSLTRLRLAAFLWMGLVVSGLVLIAVRILREKTNGWLVGANAIAAIAVLYVVCFLDLPGTIANYNVARCAELGGPGVSIDLRYMALLGESALPAYERLAREADDPTVRRAAAARARTLRAALEARTAGWRGWSIRRQRLLSSRPP